MNLFEINVEIAREDMKKARGNEEMVKAAKAFRKAVSDLDNFNNG